VEVGTTITCDGGDDTFAFATLLPFQDSGIVGRCVSELKTALSNFSRSSHLKDHFMFSDLTKTGLLLHSRFTNLPLQLIGPLFRNVEHDLQWLKDGDNAASPTIVSQFGNINNILLLCPCSMSDSSENSRLTVGNSIDITGSSSLLFDYFEDEIFFEEATSAALYRTEGLNKTIAAILIPLSSMKKCAEKLSSMLPDIPV
jgi:hypothetical protein